MARQATGQLTTWTRSDGSKGYGCRFRFKGKRYHELLGSSQDGMTLRTARTALQDLMADVRAGRWIQPEQRVPEPIPRFHEFASQWFERLCAEGGRHGDGLSERSVRDLRDWRLKEHILPYFAEFRVDEIGVADVDRFRSRLKREGRLSNASVNKMVATVATILEWAVELEHIDRNPAASRSLRLRTERPDRTWLERPEQVVALLAAAGQLDDRGRGVRYRRPLLATLVFAGPRIGEALELRWRDVDLDGKRNGNVVVLPVKGKPPASTIHIRGSKTDAAERKVRLAPALRAELAALSDSSVVSPDRLVFATGKGHRFSESNIRNRVLRPAVKLANEALAGEGLEPIVPGITPHSLRRTFASMLAMRNVPPRLAMGQMGHATSALTLEVYQQVADDLTDAGLEAWEELWQGRFGQGLGNRTPEADSDAGQQEAV